jgi:hypothetical protein
MAMTLSQSTSYRRSFINCFTSLPMVEFSHASGNRFAAQLLSMPSYFGLPTWIPGRKRFGIANARAWLMTSPICGIDGFTWYSGCSRGPTMTISYSPSRFLSNSSCRHSVPNWQQKRERGCSWLFPLPVQVVLSYEPPVVQTQFIV